MNIKNSGLSNHLHHNHKNLVSYIRPTATKPVEYQRRLIEEYCMSNGCKIASEFIDQDHPGVGLIDALKELQMCDGLITVDLERFVTHHKERCRELRPLLHEFLHDRGRQLIVIEEGIDTSSPAGQMAALEFINQLKDAEQEGPQTFGIDVQMW